LSEFNLHLIHKGCLFKKCRLRFPWWRVVKVHEAKGHLNIVTDIVTDHQVAFVRMQVGDQGTNPKEPDQTSRTNGCRTPCPDYRGNHSIRFVTVVHGYVQRVTYTLIRRKSPVKFGIFGCLGVCL
jgi:hypothetical protein